MKKQRNAIACGLLLAVGLAGCSNDDGPSVPKGAGADTAVKDTGKPGATQSKKSAQLSNAFD